MHPLAVAAAGRRPVSGRCARRRPVVAAVGALEAGAAAVLLLPETGSVDDAERGASGGRRRDRRTAAGRALPARPAVPRARRPASARRGSRYLVGLKDAHGDMRRFRRLREALGSRLTWIGASEDLVLAFWAYGADAVSPASLAYAPWYARRVWDALCRGDRDEASGSSARSRGPSRTCACRARTSTSRSPASSPREFGLAVGEARAPAEPLTADEQSEVRAARGGAAPARGRLSDRRIRRVRAPRPGTRTRPPASPG